MGLTMNAVFFCNLTPCNLVDNYQRFGRKYVHHWEDVWHHGVTCQGKAIFVLFIFRFLVGSWKDEKFLTDRWKTFTEFTGNLILYCVMNMTVLIGH